MHSCQIIQKEGRVSWSENMEHMHSMNKIVYKIQKLKSWTIYNSCSVNFPSEKNNNMEFNTKIWGEIWRILQLYAHVKKHLSSRKKISFISYLAFLTSLVFGTIWNELVLILLKWSQNCCLRVVECQFITGHVSFHPLVDHFCTFVKCYTY